MYPGLGSALPPAHSFHSCQLGTPHRPALSQRMGFLWLGLVPSLLPTKDQGPRMSIKELAKAIALYFSFLPFNQFAEAEDEWILEAKEEHLGTDPPKIVFVHC